MSRYGIYCMLTEEEYGTLAKLAEKKAISGAGWMRMQIMGVTTDQIEEIVAQNPVEEATRNVEFNRLCKACVKDHLVALAKELQDGSEAIVLRALLQKAIKEEANEQAK